MVKQHNDNHPLTKQELIEALHAFTRDVWVPGIEFILDRVLERIQASLENKELKRHKLAKPKELELLADFVRR